MFGGYVTEEIITWLLKFRWKWGWNCTQENRGCKRWITPNSTLSWVFNGIFALKKVKFGTCSRSRSAIWWKGNSMEISLCSISSTKSCKLGRIARMTSRWWNHWSARELTWMWRRRSEVWGRMKPGIIRKEILRRRLMCKQIRFGQASNSCS